MTKVFARTRISSSKTTLVNTARTAGLVRLLSCNVKSGAKFDSGAGDWHVYATVTRQLAREAQISSGTQGLAQSLVLGGGKFLMQPRNSLMQQSTVEKVLGGVLSKIT